MASDRNTGPRSGNMTPQDLADPSKHQHGQVFERETRPQRSTSGVNPDADDQCQAGEDMLGGGNAPIGDTVGPDTTGAVAPPAAGNHAGASTKLGGTPGALAVPGGRDAD